MIRRICLYGGPGSGKSTAASFLFAELKKQQFHVEQVHEYVKSWAHEKRVPTSFDQVYIFGKQLHAEDLLLKSGIPVIITDSPLFLNITYARTLGPTSTYEPLAVIAREFEKVYPAMHVRLKRDGIKYEESGRYQTLEEAEKLDHEITYTLLTNLDKTVYTSSKIETCWSHNHADLLHKVKEGIKCQKTT